MKDKRSDTDEFLRRRFEQQNIIDPESQEELDFRLISPEDKTNNRFISRDVKTGKIDDPARLVKLELHVTFAKELDDLGLSEAAEYMADFANTAYVSSGSLGGFQQNILRSQKTEVTQHMSENRKPMSLEKLNEKKTLW